jgi:hypothetical protein
MFDPLNVISAFKKLINTKAYKKLILSTEGYLSFWINFPQIQNTTALSDLLLDERDEDGKKDACPPCLA